MATVTALLFVPDGPHRHLSEPSYWGIAGFVLVAVLLLRRHGSSWSRATTNRRVVLSFLVGLPIVYVASWLRFGGSNSALAVEALGLVVWLAIALAARSSDSALWLGCAGHALWDAAHFGRVEFIPDWYVSACIAADLGLGAFVLLTVAADPDREPPN